LDRERWARFSLDQQILMIGNEMNRATRMMGPDDAEGRRRGYERVLRLTDLTTQGALRRAARRELLRWRDQVAALYVSGLADPLRHREALRALLLLRPFAARQIPLLLR
jgi:hypothetical protein